MGEAQKQLQKRLDELNALETELNKRSLPSPAPVPKPVSISEPKTPEPKSIPKTPEPIQQADPEPPVQIIQNQ